MNKKDIIKAVRKYIFENRDNLGIWTGFDSKEMMGAARKAAMDDIKKSGEEFVDLGKSKFEKDLSVDGMLKDLENAKQGKTGKNLARIEKQINQLKRFGSGSLNETGVGIGDRNHSNGYIFKHEEAVKEIRKLNLEKIGKTGEELANIEKKITNLKSQMPLREFEEDEFEGSAKDVARRDIEAAGEKFVDLGQSKFEKNLDKHKMFKDLKDANKVNEENLDENYFVTKYADGLEKLMDKTKQYTNKEFLDLFTQKHALQHSTVMNALKDELKNRGFNIEDGIEEEIGRSLASGHGQNAKPKNFPNSLKGGRKNEGAGISLVNKKGMNVKPTHINESVEDSNPDVLKALLSNIGLTDGVDYAFSKTFQYGFLIDFINKTPDEISQIIQKFNLQDKNHNISAMQGNKYFIG